MEGVREDVVVVDEEVAAIGVVEEDADAGGASKPGTENETQTRRIRDTKICGY